MLAGPNRARSSHARTCTRTHTIEHATASGQAEMPRAGPRRADPAHKDTPTCATEPRDPGGPRTHSTSDTTTRASWVSRLTGSRRPGPRAQGSRPADTQCHWTHDVAHTDRPAGSSTYPHLGGSREQGWASGAGAGVGASGRAQARARAGGLCSARASVRTSVRRSALPHRVCGCRRLHRLICPRSRGGRRRPIKGAAALTDGRRPRPRYCSCPPCPQPPPRGSAAGGGIPEIPAMRNLETPPPAMGEGVSEEGALRK